MLSILYYNVNVAQTVNATMQQLCVQVFRGVINYFDFLTLSTLFQKLSKNMKKESLKTGFHLQNI